MKYKRRCIIFNITVKSTITDVPKVSFSSRILPGTNNDLLSYSYTDSMQQPQGNFTLSAVYSKDLDNIEVHDIVEIKEGIKGETLMFIGLIKNISYSKKINDNGQVTSVMNICGTNIFGIIAETKFVINRAIIGSLCKKSTATTFQEAINKTVKEGDDLNNIITAIKDAFLELKGENMQGGDYYTEIVNKITIKSDSLKAKYPMALGYLGAEQCTLWQLISQIVPPPIYESYLLLNGDKYNLVIRESPFLSKKNITQKTLDDLYLKGFDLHKKDNEVYSYYLPLISGSGQTQNIIQVRMDDTKEPGENPDKNDADKQIENAINIDSDAMARFGYRPLIVECGFFDNTQFADMQKIEDIAKNLLNANKNNHKKLSGTIDALHDSTKWDIGTVIKCQDIEFYIEQIENHWNYGQAHTRKFFVTRGGKTVNLM